MSSRLHTHKDVEFLVEDASGNQRSFRRFDEAAGFAVGLSASTGKEWNIDVTIYSRAGADWWGGDYAVQEYESDPEASVSDRITVKAEDVGRVY